MTQRLSRQELYDLVWSEPMRTLAKRFGISDVALAKSCRRMHIPVPPRGYWAKKEFGKSAPRVELPPRPVGLHDMVVVGRDTHTALGQSATQVGVVDAVPSAPVFNESLEAVRERVEAAVSRVPVPKDLEAPHPVVAKLLAQDEVRRQRARDSGFVISWDMPLYESPMQRRRLRLLSAILTALDGQGCQARRTLGSPGTHGGPENDFIAFVGHQSVHVRVSVVEVEKAVRGTRTPRRHAAFLRVVVDPGENRTQDGQAWEDGEKSLDQQARDIVLAILLRGEERQRAAAVSLHKWRVQAKAAAVERARREREEAIRKERERLARLERRRVERLLGEAKAFRNARDIRAYVELARAANASAPDPAAPGDIAAWSEWALAQADRIDPVMTGAFRVVDADEG